MSDEKGQAKFDAWDAKKGVSQDQAKSDYIELSEQMMEKHGSN